jgi:hypothetical protein
MRREGYAAMIEMCGYVFSTFFVSFVWLNFLCTRFERFLIFPSFFFRYGVRLERR